MYTRRWRLSEKQAKATEQNDNKEPLADLVAAVVAGATTVAALRATTVTTLSAVTTVAAGATTVTTLSAVTTVAAGATTVTT
ncbi:hypothetical protein DSO57_1035069 [Entomophthora muscae]|uniref:Uncharacterized protein n=1 Tax=Entomophthora muscae TaxID=34485 RepID=A0ACC2SCA7_9FUNG|nr:hypothetical protein DSO57_1035069 [Entomophthora muscae]